MSPEVVEVDLITACGGNLASMRYSLERMNVSYRLVGDGQLPDGSRPMILPGVGAFGAVMEKLQRGGLAERVTSLAKSGVPLLGVCVGLQVLFDESEESPGAKGLGLFKGRVKKFSAGKVPQIGWNKIQKNNSDDAGFVYFVNSYFADPADSEIVSYRADYFGEFCAAVESGSITAFQFHPEKSGEYGQKLLNRWVDSVK